MVSKAPLDISDGPPSQTRRQRCGTAPGVAGEWSAAGNEAVPGAGSICSRSLPRASFPCCWCLMAAMLRARGMRLPGDSPSGCSIPAHPAGTWVLPALHRSPRPQIFLLLSFLCCRRDQRQADTDIKRLPGSLAGRGCPGPRAPGLPSAARPAPSRPGGGSGPQPRRVRRDHPAVLTLPGPTRPPPCPVVSPQSISQRGPAERRRRRRARSIHTSLGPGSGGTPGPGSAPPLARSR